MKRNDFSASEWQSLLYNAAYVAIAVVLTDKADPVIFLKQTQTAARILTRELRQCDAYSAFVHSIITSMEELDSSDLLWEEELLFAKTCELLECFQSWRNAQEGLNAALLHCQQVASILASKVPAIQAHDYRMWHLSLARKIVEAIQISSRASIAAKTRQFEILNALDRALQNESCSNLQLTQPDFREA